MGKTTFCMAILSCCVALVLGAADVCQGQESDSSGQGAKKAPRGRLPAYFKDVVSETQRDEIYKIQGLYEKKLDALEQRYEELSKEVKTLRDQIDGIKQEEQTAVEGVLTPKQVAQIKRLRAEAQSRLAQELLKAAEEAARRAQELANPD